LHRLGVYLHTRPEREAASALIISQHLSNRRCSFRRSVLLRHRLRPVWRIVLRHASPKAK